MNIWTDEIVWFYIGPVTASCGKYEYDNEHSDYIIG
jgi:hypothetical protein